MIHEIWHGQYGHKTLNQMIDIHRTMPLTRINCVWSDIWNGWALNGAHLIPDLAQAAARPGATKWHRHSSCQWDSNYTLPFLTGCSEPYLASTIVLKVCLKVVPLVFVLLGLQLLSHLTDACFRAPHFAWWSPILSRPGIMFSLRVCYDFPNRRHKCREIKLFRCASIS